MPDRAFTQPRRSPPHNSTSTHPRQRHHSIIRPIHLHALPRLRRPPGAPRHPGRRQGRIRLQYVCQRRASVCRVHHDQGVERHVGVVWQVGEARGGSGGKMGDGRQKRIGEWTRLGGRWMRSRRGARIRENRSRKILGQISLRNSSTALRVAAAGGRGLMR